MMLLLSKFFVVNVDLVTSSCFFLKEPKSWKFCKSCNISICFFDFWLTLSDSVDWELMENY